MKKKITYKDLIAMKPCYHPKEIGIKSNYSATIRDFIKEYRHKVKRKNDIIWVVCRNDYMTDKDMRLFAVWCAEEALKLIDSPDERSINACKVAKKYANGDATDKELSVAAAAAKDAAWAAARAANADAATTYDAVNAAAVAAAYATNAAYAAVNAAYAAVDAAVDAVDAAVDAADAAVDAADAVAAEDAAKDAQIDKLLTYF